MVDYGHRQVPRRWPLCACVDRVVYPGWYSVKIYTVTSARIEAKEPSISSTLQMSQLIKSAVGSAVCTGIKTRMCRMTWLFSTART